MCLQLYGPNGSIRSSITSITSKFYHLYHLRSAHVKDGNRCIPTVYFKCVSNVVVVMNWPRLDKNQVTFKRQSCYASSARIQKEKKRDTVVAERTPESCS